MRFIKKSDSFVPILSLFTSMSTLICCALPALLVSLGMGAVVAGAVSAVPQLTLLSEHKVLLFSVAGGMLAFACFMQYRARFLPCPADPVQAKACQGLRRFSIWVTGISVILYLIGFFFAFVAARLFA